MKQLALFLLSIAAFASHASDPPSSGTFSNVKNSETGGYTTSLKNKINLVVTVNQSGQQFFIQCFSGDKAGFGVVTTHKKVLRTNTIKAGPECLASEVQIELDYDSAYVRTEKGWVYLPRGDIYVPFEE